jgi:hypothetical protein
MSAAVLSVRRQVSDERYIAVKSAFTASVCILAAPPDTSNIHVAARGDRFQLAEIV